MALDDFGTKKAIEAVALALTGTLPGLIAAARLAAASGVELGFPPNRGGSSLVDRALHPPAPQVHPARSRAS
jgi:hypothetical protein